MKTRLVCTVALALILAAAAAASDATTGQLVLAANAAAVQDGGRQSITSLFNTKFANGLAQGQTVSTSVAHAAPRAEGFAPDTFLSIFTGAGVVPRTQVWGEFFKEGDDCPESIPNCVAPTELDGVEVKVNDKKAPISFIGRAADFGVDFDQINIISPDDDALGDGIKVEVSNEEGVTGETVIRLEDRAPAFFLFSPDNFRFLAAALNVPDPDTPCTFIGREDLFNGAALPGGCSIRPARPGDIVQLFGTGFGKTAPAVPAGTRQIGQELADKDMLNVMVGGQPAEVLFAGLAGFAGVIQFAVRVPEVPDGDREVVAEIAGRQTQSGAFITVQREM